MQSSTAMAEAAVKKKNETLSTNKLDLIWLKKKKN
jgi:hypothetical protein